MFYGASLVANPRVSLRVIKVRKLRYGICRAGPWKGDVRGRFSRHSPSKEKELTTLLSIVSTEPPLSSFLARSSSLIGGNHPRKEGRDGAFKWKSHQQQHRYAECIFGAVIET
ncbi:hypothetical protein Acr_03g0002780 [Actinidia rufa]|uniref:Uncharacterized protein n=1 Tax=Actinidia rufa TaxID=165716 RepID=A0A7J0EAJ0_9ERIC|nr:hypothetical protein Acr_03g0002780 [Actinidia rufa]